MNLFAQETKNALEKFMTEDWAEALSHHLQTEDFNYIKGEIKKLRAHGVVYPASGEVFKALSYPYEKVKVVIVGQDPYHDGNADGLAFSCKMNLSPSLRQILQALYKDEMQSINAPLNKINMDLYMKNRKNYNLEYLAQQGVLLYNPTLTVYEGRPQSHKGVWNKFSDAVFYALDRKQHLVWLTWGGDAKDAVKKVAPWSNKSHLHLHANHPAWASHNQSVWECDHFSKTNNWLKERGIPEIEWLQR